MDGGGPEGGADVGPDSPSCQTTPVSYLSFQDAARLCTLTFACPQLQSTIAYSTQVPIDQDNFSLCMTWATGPIAPSRIGFALQQPQLQCAAAAFPSCLAAGACFVFEQLATGDPRCQGRPDGGACLSANSALNCNILQVQH